MSRKENEMEREFESENLSAETAETTETKEKRVFTDSEGNQVSCSAFCREKFVKDNMSRKEISETYGIDYRTVYGACQNLTNDAPAASRGRSSANTQIRTDANGNVLAADKEGNKFVNGEAAPDADPAEFTTMVNRTEWIKAQFEAGKTRAEIATILQVPPGVVYAATKEYGSSRGHVMITLEAGTEVERSKYIKQLYEAGKTRAEIAKELNIAYNIVFQATKEKKSDQEKLDAILASLDKYADKVADKETFTTLLEGLKNIKVVEVAEEAEVDAE